MLHQFVDQFFVYITDILLGV